ncbi:MAG TPA: hypothetical protein VGU25_04050 [Acidobacteriaceae bacterium]|nr:hypothetical protein [Acidobacteriaceae bacterium]
MTVFAQSESKWLGIIVVCFACVLPLSKSAEAQGLTIHAVEDGTNKPLRDIPITLRYNCTPVDSGLKLKWHGCKWIQRRTDKAGIASFPEAPSLPNIDDVYSLPITYGMTCCDVQPKSFPAEATMKFRKRTLAEQLHWIFVGD